MCVLCFEAGGIGLNWCWCAQMAIYRCLLDIAAGMDYLHSLGVLHGEPFTAILLLSNSPFSCDVACPLGHL